MSNKSIQNMFVGLFFTAVMVFCVLVIGVFLLIVKISLLFTPQIHLMGLAISQV